MVESNEAFDVQKAKIIEGVKAIKDYDVYMEEAKQVIATAKAGGDKYK
jgi:hypothetical protein